MALRQVLSTACTVDIPKHSDIQSLIDRVFIVRVRLPGVRSLLLYVKTGNHIQFIGICSDSELACMCERGPNTHCSIITGGWREGIETERLDI